METTSQLIAFFEKYKDYNLHVTKQKIISKKETYKQLIHGFESINSTIANYEKQVASTYNIFWLLKNIYKDETRTHSPFLADLLNINGEHKQKDLFYNQFLSLLNIEEKIKFTPTIPHLQIVEIEKWTGNDSLGRLDILISYFDKEKRFAIAIENKIYAEDQPKQLERYYNYLKSLYDNFLLVYLTPHGHKPAIPYSISNELYEELTKNKILILASYDKEISVLIESTIEQIKAQKVHQIVSQYLEIIKSL
ncbi:MAG: hypothetical protein A2X12_08925 [Bacteroidetes bacterium GWE2_29_8]|nr:MAG: hypothetical protein A2X12_08925 [Bacteroidetes bacterium GWE2_29_8]OFY23323.1 MAG: hypothetical protein A2X02_08630 [Bacteroidetes bacterium GWF2_29_10]